MRQGEFNELLISIATEPSNKFNAHFLHRELMAKSMPERDASWSILLAARGLEGPVETLITWATRSSHEHIDGERALLAGTMLTWLFTTSHREVRDKATKALACVLRTVIHIRLPTEPRGSPFLRDSALGAWQGNTRHRP